MSTGRATRSSAVAASTASPSAAAASAASSVNGAWTPPPAKHRQLGDVETVHAPRDRRQQRLLARQGGAGTACEQPECVAQAGRDPCDRHRTGAGRSQLDGQRDPIETSADRRDVRRRHVVDDEVGAPLRARSMNKRTES